jgi:peptide/nickel transport system permease protein
VSAVDPVPREGALRARQAPARGRLIGALLLGALVAFALLEALLGGADPAAQDLDAALTPPGAEHPLGTDPFGRSMLARLGAALRLSLLVSTACVVTALVLGAGLGVLAAWRGGWTDRVLSTVVNLLLALPGLVLILLVAALAPGSLPVLYGAIALVLWVEYFRVARAVAAPAVRSPAMEASRLLGFGVLYRFRRHVLPALLPPLLAQAAFGAATAVMALASLGFVSVGLQPPTAELGLMMVELFPYYSAAPWAIAQPIAALSVYVFSLHLLAGGTER